MRLIKKNYQYVQSPNNYSDSNLKKAMFVDTFLYRPKNLKHELRKCWKYESFEILKVLTVWKLCHWEIFAQGAWPACSDVQSSRKQGGERKGAVAKHPRFLSLIYNLNIQNIYLWCTI